MRFLAWFFVAIGLVATAQRLYFTVVEDTLAEIPAEGYLVILSSLYILVLFFFVALRGRAPSGWLPWS
jgi:hypothetical protein